MTVALLQSEQSLQYSDLNQTKSVQTSIDKPVQSDAMNQTELCEVNYQSPIADLSHISENEGFSS